MEGKTHKIIAPIFTFGVSTAYFMANSDVSLPLTLVGTTGIAAVSSYFSACWPDADQHAKYMPVCVIWAGFSPFTDALVSARGVKKIRKRVDSKGNKVPKKKAKCSYLYKNKKYPKVKHVGSRIWATLFRMMGLRAHRDWRSHSPLIWCFVWYWLYYMSCLIPIEPISMIASPIVLGFGLGYISHIVGDAFTKSGIPLLPDVGVVQKFPVLNHLTEVRFLKGKFFRANNKLWNGIVICLIADAMLFLISPDFAMSINSFIFDTIWTIILVIYNSILAMFTGG